MNKSYWPSFSVLGKNEWYWPIFFLYWLLTKFLFSSEKVVHQTVIRLKSKVKANSKDHDQTAS